LRFNCFGFKPPAHLTWSNDIERVQSWLSIGVDDWLEVSLPMEFHPDVKVHQWEEATPGRRWPLMVKEYETPVGPLRQEVYRTDDWATSDWPEHQSAREGIQLFDDYNVPRSRARRFLVEAEEDIEKLKYLLHPLPEEAIARFREEAATVARQARELGVLLVGYEPAGADVAAWLCGVEGMVLMAMDQPEAFQELLQVIHEWDKRNMEIMLDTPVELFLRRGYYEGTIFWSPRMYSDLFAPRIHEITDMVHQHGRLMGYTMSVGVAPLLDIFVDIGYDVLHLLDPIQHDGTRLDLGRVRTTFDRRIAIIGGLNEPITLEQGTPEQIRQEVFDAIRILGPGGGLVLSPAEAIMAGTPWKSIEILIEAWKQVRNCPITGC